MIVGVVATAVSLYYYLGVVRAMYMRPAGGAAAGAGRPAARRRASGCCRRPWRAALAVTVGSFFVVQPLIDLAQARRSLDLLLAALGADARVARTA